MASLTGTKIKDSYDGLLKTTDNGALGASAKQITDGLGNSSGVYLGTSGNVGIGTVPNNWGYTATQLNGGGAIFGSAGGNTNSGITHGAYFDGTNWKYIYTGVGATKYESVGSSSPYQAFYTANSGTANGNITWTEAMRITSGGSVLVGRDNDSFTDNGFCLFAGGSAYGVADGGVVFLLKRKSSSGEIIRFYNDGNISGNISVSGASASYNTSSDYRLKEDWQPMADALTRIDALNPINFAWKFDGSRVDGFLAHELQEVIPEAVTGEKDAMRDEEYEVSPAVYEDVVHPAVDEVLDEEGNILTPAQEEWTEQVLVSEAVMGTRSVPDYQGIDQSKIVPLLVAAIQELKAEVDALKGA